MHSIYWRQVATGNWQLCRSICFNIVFVFVSSALRKRSDQRNVCSQLHTLRPIAIHSNVLCRSDAIIRIGIWNFAVCSFVRSVVCRDPSSNALCCFYAKSVYTGHRSIVVKRFENIKIASPHIGAQKKQDIIVVCRESESNKNTQILFWFVAYRRLPFFLFARVDDNAPHFFFNQWANCFCGRHSTGKNRKSTFPSEFNKISYYSEIGVKRMLGLGPYANVRSNDVSHHIQMLISLSIDDRKNITSKAYVCGAVVSITWPDDKSNIQMGYYLLFCNTRNVWCLKFWTTFLWAVRGGDRVCNTSTFWCEHEKTGLAHDHN